MDSVLRGESMAEGQTVLVEMIKRAFGRRKMPASAVDGDAWVDDSDVKDAMWFSGRDWRGIALQDWRDHMCAYTFMSAEAGQYYLPSLLILSAQNPSEWIYSLDALISELDCTPELGVRDERIRDRYLGFKADEYAAIQEWLLFMSENAPDLGYPTSGVGDKFGRAFALVDLLRKETEALRLVAGDASESDLD